MSRSRVSGVLVADKPEGPTSHDVVGRVRRVLRTRVGHAGTLDPLATGVLPLLLGNATRLLRFYQGCDKSYRADIRFGASTDTYDREGQVVSMAPVPVLSDSDVASLLAEFSGEIDQIPPMFSAVKVGGERLYEVARRGESRIRKARSVTIHSIRVVQRLPELWTLEITCSAGTYIRSLAHDIGQAAGSGAHLENLRRLSSGPFDLSHAVSLDELVERWHARLIPMSQLLPEFPVIVLSGAEWLRVGNGNPVPASVGAGAGYHRLFFEGRLVSIGELRENLLHPVIVFPEEGEEE